MLLMGYFRNRNTKLARNNSMRKQAFAVLAHNFCGLEEIFSPNCVSAYKLLTHKSSMNALFDSLLKNISKKFE